MVNDCDHDPLYRDCSSIDTLSGTQYQDWCLRCGALSGLYRRGEQPQHWDVPLRQLDPDRARVRELEHLACKGHLPAFEVQVRQRRHALLISDVERAEKETDDWLRRQRETP